MRSSVLGLGAALVIGAGGLVAVDSMSDEINWLPFLNQEVEVTQDDDSTTPQIRSVDPEEVMGEWAIESDFEAGPETATVEVELALESVHLMNEYLGYPLDNEGEVANVLKMHSACYDNSLDRAFAVGIMTPHIAVIQDDEVVSYIQTDVGEGDFILKQLFCEDGMLFMVTEDSVMTIDSETETIVDTLAVESLFIPSFEFDVEGGWFSYAALEGNVSTREIRSIETGSLLAEVEFDKSDLYVLDDGTLMMVEHVPERNSGYTVSLLDGTSFEVADRFMLEVQAPIAEDTAYDAERNEVWVLTGSELMVFDLDNPEQVADRFERLIPEATELIYGNDYLVVLSYNGYQEDGTDNFRGGIAVLDAGTRELRYSVEINHIHKDMDIDLDNNMLYLINNNDNSVDRVNLETGEVEATIHVGSSTEGGVILSDGSLMLRNRLGGSSYFHFDPETGAFEHLDAEGEWPVGIAYSEALDRVIGYNFLGSSLSYLDPESESFEGLYELGVADASTDGIGSMIHDETRDVVYMAIPEQNAVVVFDIETETTLATIELEDYLNDSRGYEDLKGAGVLSLAFYEPNATLFVYANNAERIYVYDGLNNFELVDSVRVEPEALRGLKNFPYGFAVDHDRGLLYVGSGVYDAETYEYLGLLEYGDSVAAIDNQRGLLMTVGIERGAEEQETLYVMDRTGELLDQIDLNSNQYVKPLFEYDEDTGMLYAFYMVSSQVWEISVF